MSRNPTPASSSGPSTLHRIGARAARASGKSRLAVEGVAHRHQHALLLGEVLDAFGAVLATDAGVLVAAERAAGIERIPVDRVRPGADLLRDLDAARHIGGPHAAGQPIRRVV